jgi:DNA polymerase I-like protein with 3'-5' exonuclease and polymerase domains
MGKTVKTRTAYRLVGSDYSAQEPRLTAFMSGDENMQRVYAEGKDLYCVIAASIFNNKYEENLEFYPEGTEIELDGKKIICGNKTHMNKAGKERRSVSKMVLLALTYGMAAGTLATRINKTKDEAQEILDNFFKSFPKVKQLIEDSKKSLRENGYVEDWAGRRRHLSDYFLARYEAAYKDEEKLLAMTFNPIFGCEDRPATDATLQAWVKKAEATRGNKAFEALAVEALKEDIILTANTGRIAQAERQCLNARIQGGAASLTKLAMVNIARSQELKELGANLIITVHDEVLMECPAANAERVAELLPQIMIDTAKPYISVGMKCDPMIVSRWYADEYAVAVRAEFKKLEDKGYSREDAFKKLYENHPELSEECIYDAIVNGSDLEF